MASPVVKPVVEAYAPKPQDSPSHDKPPKPWYRVKICLWYLDLDRTPPNNTALIKKAFPDAEKANNAAFDLAKCCLGEGQTVVLINRREIGIDKLNEYAVGKWPWSKDEKSPPGQVDLIDHRQIGYHKHNSTGVITGLVQVIRESLEDGLAIGRLVVGRSKAGSLDQTWHPKTAEFFCVSQMQGTMIRRRRLVPQCCSVSLERKNSEKNDEKAIVAIKEEQDRIDYVEQIWWEWVESEDLANKMEAEEIQ